MRNVPRTIGDHKCSISALAFDPEGKTIAVGDFEGNLKLYSPITGKVQANLHNSLKEENEGYQPSPITCIRWKPNKVGTSLRSSTLICALASDGVIYHYNVGTGKLLAENDHHKTIKNNLYCGDYTCDGWKLVVGGSDRNLYVYDEHTRQLIKTMNSRDEKITGHTNRIYSIKCHPDDPNLFFSAGFDHSLMIYDIKDGLPIA